MMRLPARVCLSFLVVVVLTTLILPGTTVRANAQSEALRARAFDLAYNLDQAEAIETLRQAVAADPNDAAAYRGIATVTWLRILFKRGVVTVDDYMGHVTNSEKALAKSTPEDDRQFRQNIERALAISERLVASHPNDPDAHYQLGTTVGLEATYSATVEGKLMGGLRTARRAYNEHETVLELDPKRQDAAFIVGTYRYIVSNLPLPVRLLAYVAGFGGGKERGVSMIEQAARFPSEAQPDARFLLVVLYNRERRFADAMRVIGELKAQFPRNRLLWLEAGATELRAGNAARAYAELNDGMAMLARDSRPRAYGEEAMWHFKRGAALVLLKRPAEAQVELAASLAADGRDWLHGRAHTELGKLADLAGDRKRATNEYQAAIRLGQGDNDPAAVAEAESLIRTAYRK